MTSTSHLAPLLFNTQTGEPFLRLLPPHSNIILTPPRVTDAEAIVPLMNDERVYRWLEGPPFPYYIEHARDWLEGTIKRAGSILQELQENPDKFVGGCPVRILREVGDDREEVFLGDCGVDRYGWTEIGDETMREQMAQENNARVAGDREIVYDIGDYLAPSHHGKGIMTVAVKTIIEEWMIPRMGAMKIKGLTFKGNVGSVRVFEKNGFVMEKTLENFKVIPDIKGGGKIGMHVLCRQL